MSNPVDRASNRQQLLRAALALLTASCSAPVAPTDAQTPTDAILLCPPEPTFDAAVLTNPVARFHRMQLSIVSDSLVVVDTERGSEHTLHPVTAAVWLSCDGATTVTAMRERIGRELSLDVPESVAWHILDRLADAQLLLFRVSPPGGAMAVPPDSQLATEYGFTAANLLVTREAPRPITPVCAPSDGELAAVRAMELQAKARAELGNKNRRGDAGSLDAQTEDASAADSAMDADPTPDAAMDSGVFSDAGPINDADVSLEPDVIGDASAAEMRAKQVAAEMAAKETRQKEATSKESSSKESASKETATKEATSKEARSKESMNKSEVASKELGSKEVSSKEMLSKMSDAGSRG
jgi:hypothetical protein